MSVKWSDPTNFDVVYKRAGGRRHYHARRQAEARERYQHVLKAISQPDGRKRGAQAHLARTLGVHRSTICRDVAKWRKLLIEVMSHLDDRTDSRSALESQCLVKGQLECRASQEMAHLKK